MTKMSILRATATIVTAVRLVGLGVLLACASDVANATQIFITSGTSWTVPNDWNNAANTVECIGGGGGGGTHVASKAGGGGGGGYGKVSNLVLQLGQAISVHIGAAGGAGAAGGDTWFNGTSSASALCGAKGGGAGSSSGGGAGGLASLGSGTVTYSGGAGGTGGTGGGGGGGAAGPNGNGGAGGGTAGVGGGGGGGASGGGAGVSAPSSGYNGGRGGNNSAGTGGGPTYYYSFGGPGTAVAGVGGAGGGGGGDAYGGAGAIGEEWDASHGAGGGGGAASWTLSGSNNAGGAAGSFGGGGGGGGNNGTGGAGAPGIIVITYTPVAVPPPTTGVTGTRVSSFGYDTSSGLLTKEVVEPNTSALRLETDYTYDSFGHKLTATVSGIDIVTRGSSTTYTSNGQFAASNTNALGQSESWQYDARYGSPSSHTGPNGLTTTWTYDDFGRKTQELRADGTKSLWSYAFCSGVNGGTASCPTGAAYLVIATSLASDGVTQNAPTGTVYFDSLDREIARDTQGFDGSAVRATKQYDALGRVLKTSRPFFVATGTPQLTTYAYDALGRVTSATTPDTGVSTTAYHGLVVTETNALSQTRTLTKNSQGKLVSVTDALGKTMTFGYEPFGNLVKTTDAAGNHVTATYDTRGRKTATSDPDMGAWSYSYNTLDQLVSQTDAKSQVTTLSYDKLNRMVQRVEADMTSTWTYDTATNGIGKLAATAITAGPGSGFQRSVSYDTLGRPIGISTTIGSSTYTSSAVYDANSRLSSVSYASGFTAQYGYTALGYANQLADASSGFVYWTANAMDAEQHLTQETSGNGLVTNNSFDITTGHLLSTQAGRSNAVQNFAYTYDLLGNPLSRSDANTNLSETFTYDALNRLTSTTVNLSPTPLAKSFTYDVIGNLLTKSDVGTYSYVAPGNPLPHAVMGVSGGTISTTFSYDPNGNQTAGLGRNITFSSYNKPASITQGTRTISFLDDTSHQRFQQTAPEGVTHYVGGFGVLSEHFAPGTSSEQWTDYLTVGNLKVGMRVTQVATATLTTRYFHTDHLGSVSVITDENGVVVQRLSYDAWGKRRYPDGSDDPTGSITSQTTRGFTGQEELSVAGLVHLNGRVYDPLLARMTSPDPTVTDPTNPQGWNRYSYVGNDPLAFVDPNGFSWLSSFFHAVTNFIASNPIVRSIVQIAATIILNSILPGSGVLLAVASAAGGAMIATGLAGGNLSSMLRNAAIAGMTAFAFYGVGDLTLGPNHNMPSFDSPNFNPSVYAENVAGHALVGCGSAVLSGGSCEAGALSGAAGSAVTPFTANLSLVGGTIVTATAGGLASVAGGGKFADGAVTAAFGYLFNAMGNKINQLDIGNDAHVTLQSYVRDEAALFTESSSDGAGGSFWGRVDIGNRDTLELWEIKPNNLIGQIAAQTEAEFYAMTSSGSGRDYQPGGNPTFLPGQPLEGKYGFYTYTYGGNGAILYDTQVKSEFVYAPTPIRILPMLPAPATVLRIVPVIP